MSKAYIPRVNDLKIMRSINMFRFLPLKVLSQIMIRQKIYSSYQAVARSVQRLEKEYIIKSIVYENNSKILFLSEKGANVLAYELCIPKEDINTPSRNNRANFFAIDHTLKMTELYMLFESECRKHGLTLKYFKGDKATRFEFRLSSKRKTQNRRYVLPDGVMKIEKGNIEREYFIEFDRSTEYSDDIARKYAKYYGYFDKHFYHTPKQDKYPSIIFINETSRKRIMNLIAKDDNFNSNVEYYYGHNNEYQNVVHRGLVFYEDRRSAYSSRVEAFLQENKFLFIDYPTFKKHGLKTDFFTYLQNKHCLLEDFREKKKDDNIKVTTTNNELADPAIFG
jgi:hypothetical protein